MVSARENGTIDMQIQINYLVLRLLRQLTVVYVLYFLSELILLIYDKSDFEL